MSTLRFRDLCILLVPLMLVACSVDDNTNTQKSADDLNCSFGHTITAKVNKNARIGTAPNEVAVTVKSITDSRCPSDAVCVWEGRSEVTFNIDGINSPVIMCTGNMTSCEPNPYEFAIAGQKYRLTLKDVTPYPSTTNGDEVKEALFFLEML